jgi:heptaprenyl diphosphate synthase
MGSFWEAYPRLAEGLAEVRQIILSQDVAEDPGVRESVRRLVESNGKMLRPGFVILSSLFGTPDPRRITRIAAAVEMLHIATLVHDDIIDEAPLRRGVPTLSARHGARIAVLAGDSLFASCFSLVAQYAGIEEARGLSRLVARICRGEIDQSGAGECAPVSVRRYLRRIAGKTALLFSLSLFVGASQSGCPAAVGERLRRAGYCIGMGFQIMDDILDIEGDGTLTGKPTGRDLAQGVVTLPVILSLRGGAPDGLAAALSRASRSPRARRRAVGLVRERGGVSRAAESARLYTGRALREISLLPPGEPRDILREVTGRLLARSS